MNPSDIIKAREGLEYALSLAKITGIEGRVRDARESLAAFERLIAEPPCKARAMTARAHIAMEAAAQIAGRSARPANEIANESVNIADALIERLGQK